MDIELLILSGTLAVILDTVPQPFTTPPTTNEGEPHLRIATEPWGDCSLTEDLRRALGLSEHENSWTAEAFHNYRANGIYQTTPPPNHTVRMVGEFSSASTLLLAYQPFEEYDEIYGELISQASKQGNVHVMVSTRYRSNLNELLYVYDVSSDAVTVDESVDFDTVWVRDWGPEPVVNSEGIDLIDTRYFLNCLRDDAAPTLLINALGAHDVYRPDLWIEGGNLLSNGEGLCFTTTLPVRQHGGDRTFVERSLLEFFGCEQTVFLEALVGNVVEHVDMFMTLASEELVLLGQFEPGQDTENHLILEMNAELLATIRTRRGRPLTILRVPMPNRRDTNSDDFDGPLIRSYLNLSPFNGTVFVPVFDDERRFEARALEVIQQAFHDRTIVPIPVDLMAEDRGTIHCITRTFPRVSL